MHTRCSICGKDVEQDTEYYQLIKRIKSCKKDRIRKTLLTFCSEHIPQNMQRKLAHESKSKRKKRKKKNKD